MRTTVRRFTVCLALTAIVALAQTAPTFEVASVKPAAPLDMAKIAAGIQNGQMPKIGAHVDAARAEYTYMALKELIVMAYKVKPYQITGPDWISTTRFDIVAKLPEGATKADAPKMLQALLEDRFKLAVHRDKKENPVLALVVAKGGSKMKESAEAPAAIDENAPLKPGEMITEGPDGPIRMTVGKQGEATVNMGTKGSMRYRMDPATMTMHLEATQLEMSGFADMLTQFSQLSGGGGRQVVDMTDLKGYYQVTIDFSLAELMAMARAQGMDVPPLPGAGTPGVAASDPSGTSSIFAAVQALGLKLEQRKAVTEQLVIDHVEKTPTEN
ncbi:MAG: TIGR03435 family protein [Bryobacteraceae bacterium]